MTLFLNLTVIDVHNSLTFLDNLLVIVGTLAHIRTIVLLTLLWHPGIPVSLLTHDVSLLTGILFSFDHLLFSSHFLGLFLFFLTRGLFSQLTSSVSFSLVLKLLKFHFFVFALAFGVFFVVSGVVFG